MSSSFPDRWHLSCSAGVAALAATLSFTSSEAADTQFRPSAELRVESNTNKDLTPEPGSQLDTMGYIADLALLIDRRTPRSELEFLPRVRVQEYPDATQVERIEGFADLDWAYRWQRAEAKVSGSYSHQDVVNSEQPSAQFGEVNPGDPTSPESGHTKVGKTRDRFNLVPRLTYDVTQRWSLGLEALYDMASYKSDVEEGNVDYEYWGGSGFVRWVINERSDVQIGPYATFYETSDQATKIDATGGRISYNYRFSDLYELGLATYYEQSDAKYEQPEHLEQTDSAVGGELTLFRRTQVSRLRLIAGSSSTPSSRGQKTQSQQFHVQYDRALSQRLTAVAAARYIRDQSIGDRDVSENRDYFRGDLSVRYWFARDWFIGGGYRYTWQEYETDPSGADNHSVFITAGYKGLGWRP